MTLPTVVKIEPPVATTLGGCVHLDVVVLHDLQWIVGTYETVTDRFLFRDPSMISRPVTTPVLLVARVQLGEGRGK
jgi:hypothetical protein